MVENSKEDINLYKNERYDGKEVRIGYGGKMTELRKSEE
jgi:hypothetical protein